MERTPIPDDAKRVFKGVLFDVYQWEQELFDGSTKIFEKLKCLPGACVLPVLPNGNLLIAEDEQPGRRTVLTFPGGSVEEGEAPEEGAARELLEETGYACEELILWKKVQPFSKMDWPIYTFIGRGARKVADAQIDPGERITLKEISFDELIQLADEPRFQNKEMVPDFIRAQYDPVVKEQIRTTIFG